MKLARRIFVLICLVLLISAVWGAVYVRKYGFSQSWKLRIEQEVAKKGYFVEVRKLTLGPLRGLVAEDVRFFQSKKREQEIAFVDDVYLDLDFSNVLNRKQLSIKTLDIQDANLSLPLEPGNPESKEKLKIKKLSGRLIVTESQVEIVRTSAEIEGITVSIKGTLYREQDDPLLFNEKKTSSSSERRAALKQMAVRRQQIRDVLSQLKRVEYLSEARPTLEIEFRSDLDNLSDARVSARFSAREFRRDSYLVKSLEIKADYNGEKDRAVIEEVKIQDEKGDLRLTGEWREENNEIDFGLSSDANFSALISQFMDVPALDEIVFFSAPKIQMDGKIRLDEFTQEDRPDFWIPAEILGNFRCDRFVSKGGKLFDNLEFDFSASGNRFFVRNCRLAHRTGIARANLMFDSSGGDRSFRYQSEIKMDPRTFAPFFEDEGTREFLESWEFDKDSTVYIAAVGEGPTLDSKSWISKGIVDLRNFKLRGLPFDEFEANYELDGYQQVYRDIRLGRPDGVIEAAEIKYDARTKKWDVPGILSELKIFENENAEIQ